MVSSSEVFPTPASDGNDLGRDLRDMEGPTMGELMETERATRLSQGPAPVANI